MVVQEQCYRQNLQFLVISNVLTILFYKISHGKENSVSTNPALIGVHILYFKKEYLTGFVLRKTHYSSTPTSRPHLLKFIQLLRKPRSKTFDNTFIS